MKLSGAVCSGPSRPKGGGKAVSSLNKAWLGHLREERRWAWGVENLGFALLEASALVALAWLVLSSGQLISGWGYFELLVSQLIA